MITSWPAAYLIGGPVQRRFNTDKCSQVLENGSHYNSADKILTRLKAWHLDGFRKLPPGYRQGWAGVGVECIEYIQPNTSAVLQCYRILLPYSSRNQPV